MKNSKKVFMVLAGICFMVFVSGGLSYAQPNIPKEKIPSDVPPDVKKQIERLYSSNPVKRAEAAYELGFMGDKAAPAVLFLIGILDDHTELQWIEGIYGIGTPTSPCTEAAEALGKTKDPRAVEPLIATLKNANSDVRCLAAYALGEIKDPRAVEPLIATLKNANRDVRR